jgi:hypothetical protein
VGKQEPRLAGVLLSKVRTAKSRQSKDFVFCGSRRPLKLQRTSEFRSIRRDGTMEEWSIQTSIEQWQECQHHAQLPTNTGPQREMTTLSHSTIAIDMLLLCAPTVQSLSVSTVADTRYAAPLRKATTSTAPLYSDYAHRRRCVTHCSTPFVVQLLQLEDPSGS